MTTINVANNPMNTSVPYLMPEDLDNLPSELVSALRLSESDQNEMTVVNAINFAGGVANIDKIMVALYHINNHKIENRTKLANRINRMCAKGIVGRTQVGIYTTDLTKVNQDITDDVVEGEVDLSANTKEVDNMEEHNPTNPDVIGG